MDAKQVPLRELLASVPADARLVIDDADGNGSTYIPVGRLCQEAAAALAEPDYWQEEARRYAGNADYWRKRYETLAEPVQEPVTWRWGYRSVTTGEMDWRGYVEIPSHPNLRSPEIIMEPLYTAPPQRKPLTDEEIYKMYNALWQAGSTEAVAFARAIERAHGIGEKK